MLKDLSLEKIDIVKIDTEGAEWDILVLALVVVIIGGLGSLEGAILGSIIVGLLDAYGRWLLPEFSYFVLFGPMAVLLLFRATGIFGKEH